DQGARSADNLQCPTQKVRAHLRHYNIGVGAIASRNGWSQTHSKQQSVRPTLQDKAATSAPRHIQTRCQLPAQSRNVRKVMSLEPPSQLHFYVRPLITSNS